MVFIADVVIYYDVLSTLCIVSEKIQNDEWVCT